MLNLFSLKQGELGNILFTLNRVFEHNEVVSNHHCYSNDLGKMRASYISIFY